MRRIEIDLLGKIKNRLSKKQKDVGIENKEPLIPYDLFYDPFFKNREDAEAYKELEKYIEQLYKEQEERKKARIKIMQETQEDKTIKNEITQKKKKEKKIVRGF